MSHKVKDATIPHIPTGARISRWIGRNLIRIYEYLHLPISLFQLPTHLLSPLMIQARAT